MEVEEPYPGPVYKFEDLACCTMTVIVNYDVEMINLPAIFTLLPVTTKKIPAGMELQKKQNKIVLPPELNIPGEIISMRFNGQTRGIVRSINPKSFSHAIIMDIGSKERIVSLKLSRGIFEFTGITNYETAKTTTNLILGYIAQEQEKIHFLRKNLKLGVAIADYIALLNEFPTYDSLNYFSTHKETVEELYKKAEITKLLDLVEYKKKELIMLNLHYENLLLENEENRKFLPQYQQHILAKIDSLHNTANRCRQTKTKIHDFLVQQKNIIEQETIEFETILSYFKEKYYNTEDINIIPFLISFASSPYLNLYQGTLKVGECCGEMANVLFSLGFPIVQTELARVMNQAPFICKYTNANNSFAVNVQYYYLKTERNTNKYKIASHSIRVNRSGHVTYSGPDLELMKPVYYAFMKKILENFSTLRSPEKLVRKLCLKPAAASITKKEWKTLIRKEEKLRIDILNDVIPNAKTSIFDSEEQIQLLLSSKIRQKTKKVRNFFEFLETLKNRSDSCEIYKNASSLNSLDDDPNVGVESAVGVDDDNDTLTIGETGDPGEIE